MEFSRQEYWSGLPLPSPGDLPDPGIKPSSPALQEDSVLSESPGKPYLKVISGECGEGSGTPLQSSCLGNPTDGGAWEAAVKGSLRVRHD